jgi:hypothetical protein
LKPSLFESTGLKADYEATLVEPWSPYVGAILLLLAVFALMLSGEFWGVFGGIKLWGDWFNHFIGLDGVLGIHAPDSPLTHRLSLMNITLVLGAFTAALLSRQFRFNRPPALEFVWGALGGSLMGLGAVLAGGCTVGAFFVPALHASPSGFVMLVGLMIGAVIGLKLLMWTLEHISWGMSAPIPKPLSPMTLRIYPWLGLAVIVGILWWATSWQGSADEKLASRAIIILGGFAIGFVHAPLALLRRACRARTLHDRRGRHDQGSNPGAGGRHPGRLADLPGRTARSLYRHPAEILDRLAARRHRLRPRHGVRRRLRHGLALARRRGPSQAVGGSVLLRLGPAPSPARCSANPA